MSRQKEQKVKDILEILIVKNFTINSLYSLSTFNILLKLTKVISLLKHTQRLYITEMVLTCISSCSHELQFYMIYFGSFDFDAECCLINFTCVEFAQK